MDLQFIQPAVCSIDNRAIWRAQWMWESVLCCTTIENLVISLHFILLLELIDP